MRDKRRASRMVLGQPEQLDERAVPAVFVPPAVPGHSSPAPLTNVQSPIFLSVFVSPSVPGHSSPAPLTNVKAPIFLAAHAPTPVPAAAHGLNPISSRFGPRFN